GREPEMLDAFHDTFVPEAVKHEGYIRAKMLKRRSILQGTAPAAHNYRFELEVESEALRQKWIAAAGHQPVWPPHDRSTTTQHDGDADEDHWIVHRHPEEQRLQRSGQRHRAEQSDYDPHARRSQPFENDQRQNRSLIGAKCVPDPELAAALRDGECEDPVDAD